MQKEEISVPSFIPFETRSVDLTKALIAFVAASGSSRFCRVSQICEPVFNQCASADYVGFDRALTFG